MNPISIALQGVGFGAQAVAVQGFIPASQDPYSAIVPQFIRRKEPTRKPREEDEALLLATIL